MIIEVDKEGQKIIIDMVDAILRTGGIQNLSVANDVIDNMQVKKVEENGEE